jgi:hypothetical protein
MRVRDNAVHFPIFEPWRRMHRARWTASEVACFLDRRRHRARLSARDGHDGLGDQPRQRFSTLFLVCRTDFSLARSWLRSSKSANARARSWLNLAAQRGASHPARSNFARLHPNKVSPAKTASATASPT